MASVLDTGTRAGAHAAGRLEREHIAWLTTAAPTGQPVPSPVWFLWDGSELLLYSRPGTPKLRNIDANPRVAVHLDGDGQGGDIVILHGRARVSDDPPADRVPAYVEKYAAFIERNSWSPASFAADYSVPVRVRPTRLRAF